MRCEQFQKAYVVAVEGEEEHYEELMSIARQKLPGYFQEVIEADSEELFSQAHHDLEMSQLRAEQFPEENFKLLLETIKNPQFLKSRNGWVLFFIFDNDWEKLAETQKALLLQTLLEVYERFNNWMPCFYISELVGEHFPTDKAFKFFSRFAASSDETARSFVPHGFEHAVHNSQDTELTKKLWRALLQMAEDTSEKVRAEVEESLFRLANHGLTPPQQASQRKAENETIRNNVR